MNELSRLLSVGDVTGFIIDPIDKELRLRSRDQEGVPVFSIQGAINANMQSSPQYSAAPGVGQIEQAASLAAQGVSPGQQAPLSESFFLDESKVMTGGSTEPGPRQAGSGEATIDSERLNDLITFAGEKLVTQITQPVDVTVPIRPECLNKTQSGDADKINAWIAELNQA